MENPSTPVNISDIVAPAVEKKRKRMTEKDDEKKVVTKKFFPKKKKTAEKTPEEKALIVENVMARLEIAAEDDADLNRKSLPALNKLKSLPLLMDALSKKNLHQSFLDHGVLALLKKWLEPLPDGSLPNFAIRSAVLDILTNHVPVNLENPIRLKQFKESGLGKAIMFLWKSDEEKLENRKLAKGLIDQWSRFVYHKSIDYGNLTGSYPLSCNKSSSENRKKASSGAGSSRSLDQELDLCSKSGGSTERSCQGVQIPERSSLDFVVRPQSYPDVRVHLHPNQLQESSRMERIRKNIRKLADRHRKPKMTGLKLTIQDRGVFV